MLLSVCIKQKHNPKYILKLSTKRGARCRAMAGLLELQEDSEEDKLICQPHRDLYTKKKTPNSKGVHQLPTTSPPSSSLFYLVTVCTVSVGGPGRSGKRDPERHRGFGPPPYKVASCLASSTGGSSWLRSVILCLVLSVGEDYVATGLQHCTLRAVWGIRLFDVVYP